MSGHEQRLVTGIATPEHDARRVDPGWSLRAVVEILGNLRYTGHQVWNRTSADRAARC